MEAEFADAQSTWDSVAMRAKHRTGSIIFGLAVGSLVAILSYQWLTNPQNRQEREQQERVVLLSRSILAARLQLTDPQIVDALATNRRVGKVYIYPVAAGWEVSGYYRRDDSDRWHPYLLSISQQDELLKLKVKDKDPQLQVLARTDPLIELAN